MEAALLCWIVVSMGCAFVLSHIAHEHDKGEFRWFLCGLVFGVFSLVFLNFLRRVPSDQEMSNTCDSGFDASHAAPASGTLHDPMNGSR